MPWKAKLEKVAGDRAALAAVSLDASLSTEEILEDSMNIQIPDSLAVDFRNYRNTKDHLEDYFGNIDSLSIELIHRIHESVLGRNFVNSEDIIRKARKFLPKAVLDNGTYRKVEIIVNTQPQDITQNLEDLNSWIKENYRLLNPVIKAAIIYYSLARIHPYEDGNGRTAKIFIHGILYQNGIDTDNVLLVEEYYLKNRVRYYDELAKAIATEDLTEWLEFFANALLYGAIEACKLLHNLSGGSINLMTGKYISLSPNQMQVVNALQSSPRSSGAEIGRKLSLSRQYINTLLDELIELGLVSKGGTGRGSHYSLSGS